MGHSTEQKPMLITIPVSHFCEKARWALERYGIDYVEEAHVPGFHAVAVAKVGGKGSVPCLANLPGGAVLPDSSLILQYASDKAASPQDSLFPPSCDREEINRWCKRFNDELGPDVRSYFYSRTLFNPSLSGPALTYGLRPWSVEWLACQLGALWPIRIVMKNAMKISMENGNKAIARINALFDETDNALKDGRKYLCGDAFSAADLTLASLARSLAGRPHPALPPVSSYPQEMQDSLNRLADTVTGRYIQMVLSEERDKVVAVK